MLIKQYGEFWNPDLVIWGKKGPGNKGQLLGKHPEQNQEIDFWECRGVYALYENFRLVYVGQAQDQGIGKRLRDHLTDRLAGRWDMFSWYSTSSLRRSKPRKPGQRQVAPKDVTNTLEALAISMISPPLNRRYTDLPSAVRIEQGKSKGPSTIRHYLEQILEKVS